MRAFRFISQFFFLVLFASLLETFALISLSSSVAFFSSFFFPFAFYSLITLLFFLFLDGKQRADSGSNDSGSLFFFETSSAFRVSSQRDFYTLRVSV